LYRNHFAVQFQKKGFPPPLRPGYNRGMSIILPALAVAFAAFSGWLTVRIVNRRERWAKLTAVALAIALLYPASFGPACWLTAIPIPGSGTIMPPNQQ
jgi:hypothetical protein